LKLKNDGGMGFKSLLAFKLALLGKQGWRIMSNPNILISKIYKAKYFRHFDFLESNLGHNPSFVWRSICGSKFILIAGIVGESEMEEIFPPLYASVDNK
jgi:hypothetical protein